MVPGEYAWIGPTYFSAARGIKELRSICAPPVAVIRGTEPKWADIMGGRSTIEFLSAEKPDPIRPKNFDGGVIDEAAFIRDDAWEEVIRACFAQREAWLAIASTARGRKNWFHRLYKMGLDPGEPEYESMTAPTIENPYFPKAEYEHARRVLPEAVFKQEFQAEFLEDGAGVFKNMEGCFKEEEKCQCVLDAEAAGKRLPAFGIGVDLAKHVDFTVEIVICLECGHCLEFHRMNKYDWPYQKKIIIDRSEKWEAQILLDSTGVGDAIYDDLRDAGAFVTGYKFTNESKKDLIQGLMVAIENRRISWPNTGEWTVLTDELRQYEFEYTASGAIRYNAPSGYHDDCVIALALANHLINGRKRQGIY